MLPVVFPPQVAIVGFGTMVDRPLVHDGQLLVCPPLTATLAADHRVTDGHRAAHFLNVLDDLLHRPEEALARRPRGVRARRRGHRGAVPPEASPAVVATDR